MFTSLFPVTYIINIYIHIYIIKMFVRRLTIYNNIIIIATDISVSFRSIHSIINWVVCKKKSASSLLSAHRVVLRNKNNFIVIIILISRRLRRLINLRSNNDYGKKNKLCRSPFMCIKCFDYNYYATNYTNTSKATKQYSNCRRIYLYVHIIIYRYIMTNAFSTII